MNDKPNGDPSQEVEELQDPENWDWDAAEARPGVKKARAVVSVAFSRLDFDRLSEHAEVLHVPLSAFIREAALEKLSDESLNTIGYVDVGVLGSATFANQYLTTNFRLSSISPANQRPDASATEGARRGHFLAHE